MLTSIFRRALWIFLIFCAATVLAVEPELLKEKDVGNVMQQIFEQHVDKKEISKDILKHSFKVYIEQFDPDKTYLLESEIQPYLDPSDADMNSYIEKYKKGDFSEFDKLNGTIQKSIERERKIRAELTKDSGPLMLDAKNMHFTATDEFIDPAGKLPYAKTPEELKTRISHQIERFVKAEMHHFGEVPVMNKHKQILDYYEKQLEAYENHYLFIDAKGQPMAAPAKENAMTLHILKALASSLDSHTNFFDATEAYDMKVHLEKELHGIGVVLQQGIEGAVIAQIIPDSPASKSGQLKVKDEIVAVDGKSIVGEPFENVMEMIRGKDGTIVALQVKRKAGAGQMASNDQTFTVSLKREPIVMNTDRVDMSYETFGNGIIGKLVLHSFYQADNGVSSEKDLRDAIEQLKKQGNLRGLILDLRDNGGGFLTQAIKVTGLFISNGVVVISKYSDGEVRYYRDIDGKRAYDGPLIVLTSKATASAAEIVAEALQDYGVALIVGDDRTFGKGSIQSQTVTDNKSTSYFKVTVGKYYTVSGKSPQIRGVQADIVVPGQFSQANLGEKYTEAPLTSDTIEPAFNDKLKDIDAQYKPWFLKYYVPTMQHQVDDWKKMVPALKKNSEYRISHNKNYQEFLKSLKDGEETKEAETPLAANGNPGHSDLQMDEALSIMKDMIVLRSFWTIPSVGVNKSVSTASH